MRKKNFFAAVLSVAAASSVLIGQFGVVQAAEEITKDETVYVSQDADGTVTEITVTDVLTGIEASGELKDISTLDGIENTGGNETFTQGAGDELLWQTVGEDITYKGTADAPLPVGVSVTYKLDGVSVTASDLAGKSGKVEIIIQYENNSTYTDEIDGEESVLNTPFFMLSAIVMDEDIFSDIEVSQGKVITEGGVQIVLGYGMPGFIDSLKLSGDMADTFGEKLEGTVTITADAENFSLDAIYTIATSDMISEIDMEDTDDFDELSEALDDMVDASDELISGSSTLTQGLNALSSGFAAYAEGIDGLKDGTSSLASGTAQLSKGITSYTSGVSTLKKGTTQYISGTNSLAEGITAYIDGEEEIASGASTLYSAVKDFPSQYSTFSSSFLSYINGVNTLISTDTMSSLTQGAETVSDGTGDLVAALSSLENRYSQTYQALEKLSQVIDASDLAEKEKAAYQKALSSLNTLTNGGTDSDTVSMDKAAQAAGQLETDANTLSSALNSFSENANTLLSSGTSLKSAEATVHSGITSAVEGIKSLNEGLTALSKNNEALSDGASTIKKSGSELKKGFKALSANSKLLTTSASALLKGAKELSAGAKELDKASSTISSSVSALASGSSSLTGGLETFKDEGTLKLKESYDENVSTLIERMKSLTGEQAKYTSYSGISEDMDGSVTFIFQTEAIKPEDN